jgi:hypothetical protein
MGALHKMLWHGEWKTQLLLGYGALNSDATMEYVTPLNVTILSTAENDVF